MAFDLHLHTKKGSGDSSIEYGDIIPWAKRAGLQGICITEHGNRKTGIAQKLAGEGDILVLEGLEMSTELGDILIFGLEEVPRSLYRAEELREFVEGQGGVMFAAHPFRSEITRPLMLGSTPRLTLEEALPRKLFKLVDGIEVANGWSCQEDVEFCRELCSRLGLKGIAASDAHMPRQIGCCVTLFEDGVRSEQELVLALKQGAFRAEDRRPQGEHYPNHWFLESGKY